MERTVAIKKLTKILGKSLAWRIDPRAPSSEERDEAQQKLSALTTAKQEAEKAMKDRREAILAGDEQFQKLTAAYQEARKRADNTLGLVHHYKITVGISNGLFFIVKAEGDSWEEVIEELNNK